MNVRQRTNAINIRAATCFPECSVSAVQSVEEDFAESFGGGTFRDRGLHAEQAAETTDISERIAVFKDDTQSHTAGFEVRVRPLCQPSIITPSMSSLAEMYVSRIHQV